MRVFLDACVLYPTVLREVLLKVAAEGLYEPLWSPRVLEEWSRAAARLGEEQAVIASGEIALLRAAWPNAEVPDADDLSLDLPDPADVHVVAAARQAGAEIIVTLNLRDFPARAVAPIAVLHPDVFLRDIFARHPDEVTRAAESVRAEAERLSGAPWPMRKLLKKAYLPRLGKAIPDRD